MNEDTTVVQAEDGTQLILKRAPEGSPANAEGESTEAPKE